MSRNVLRIFFALPARDIRRAEEHHQLMDIGGDPELDSAPDLSDEELVAIELACVELGYD